VTGSMSVPLTVLIGFLVIAPALSTRLKETEILPEAKN